MSQILDLVFSFLINVGQNTAVTTTIHQDRCPNTKKEDITICRLCEGSCPVDAITADDKVEIAWEKCIECGICSACCPNEVFGLHFISDLTIYQQIFKALRNNTSAIIECTGVNGTFKAEKKADNNNRVYVPCLGCLPETHLLLSFSDNLTIGPCASTCRNRRGATVYNKAIRLATYLHGTLNIKESKLGETDLLPVKNMSLVTRRRFLNNVGSQILDVLVAPTIGYLGQFSDREQNMTHYSRRKFLVEIAKQYGTSHCLVSRGEVPFADIRIDERHCTLCGICSRFCPTKAIRRRESKTDCSICFEFGLCTGCQLCKEVCPEKAIQLMDTIDLMNLNQPSKSLITKKLSTCPRCKSKFIENGSDMCLSCRKREQILLSL